MVRLESSVAPRILTFPDNLMSVPAAVVLADLPLYGSDKLQ